MKTISYSFANKPKLGYQLASARNSVGAEILSSASVYSLKSSALPDAVRRCCFAPAIVFTLSEMNLEEIEIRVGRKWKSICYPAISLSIGKAISYSFCGRKGIGHVHCWKIWKQCTKIDGIGFVFKSQSRPPPTAKRPASQSRHPKQQLNFHYWAPAKGKIRYFQKTRNFPFKQEEKVLVSRTRESSCLLFYRHLKKSNAGTIEFNNFIKIEWPTDLLLN